MPAVTRSFATVGLPAPTLAASVLTAVELLGGLALLAGFFTRAAAALLAIEMVVAILFVNIKGGFFEPCGVEFPLTLLGGLLTLVALGAGGRSDSGGKPGSLSWITSSTSLVASSLIFGVDPRGSTPG